MGIFSRNKSGNSAYAKTAIKKLNASGGTVSLSRQQIVRAIADMQDAKKYLSSDEFKKVEALFSQFSTQNASETMDKDGYNNIRMVMIGQFDAVAPYLLFDGENSKNLQLYEQMQIRGLHSKGVPYDDAVRILKSDRGSIEHYYDYDPIGDMAIRKIAAVMYKKSVEYYRNNISGEKKNRNECLGYILGLYGIINKALGNAEQVQEQNIIFYLIIFLAADHMPDADITKVMQNRKEIYIYCLKKVYKPGMEIQKLIDQLGNMFAKFGEGRKLEIVGINDNLNDFSLQISSGL